MNRDALIIGFAKLRAAGFDARVELLTAAAGLPLRQCAALRREIEAVAALFAATCPAPKKVEVRPEPEPRRGKLSRQARTAWRRYAREYKERLQAHLRTQ